MALTDQDIQALFDQAVDQFSGDLNELESAIGMIVLGRYFGWLVVLLIHSPATVRKYLKMLRVDSLRDVLPEVGPLAHRSNAWRLLDSKKNFWKVVRGQIAGVRSTRVEKDPDGTS